MIPAIVAGTLRRGAALLTACAWSAPSGRVRATSGVGARPGDVGRRPVGRRQRPVREIGTGELAPDRGDLVRLARATTRHTTATRWPPLFRRCVRACAARANVAE